MLRRVRIILLTSTAATAMAMAVLGALGYLIPLSFSLPLSSRDWVVLHFYDGRVRLFRIESAGGAIRVHQRGFEPRIHVGPSEPLPSALPSELAGPNPVELSWDVPTTIGTWRTVSNWAWVWRAGRFSTEQIRQSNLRARRRVTPSPPPPPMIYLSLVRTPAWVPVCLLLWPPARAAIRAQIVRRRRRRGECAACGYSLRGLPEPRCPECGTAIGPA